MIKSTRDIVKIELTDAQHVWARRCGERLDEHRKDSRNRQEYKQGFNEIGIVGEAVFGVYLAGLGMVKGRDYEYSPPVPQLKGDKWDYRIAQGLFQIDVKAGKTTSWPHLSSTVTIDASQSDESGRTDGRNQFDKPGIDLFVFVKWIANNHANQCWIVGSATPRQFLEAPSHRLVKKGETMWLLKGGTPYLAKNDVHIVEIRDLVPMAETFLPK